MIYDSTILSHPICTLPPRVRGYPLVGALPGLLRGRFDFLEEARQTYRDSTRSI